MGVFCGKYKTPVPDGYFDHLNQMRGKKSKTVAVEGAHQPATAGNSGPVGTAADGSPVVNGNGGRTTPVTVRMEPRSPEHREDVG